MGNSMEHWKDNNLSSILEYPFDFERYIEERVREIKNIDEQRFAKEILLKGLGKAIGVLEDRYQALERRIYEELELSGKQYEIVTTIIKMEHYDAINKTLFPIKEVDLHQNTLERELSTEKEVYLGTVFLKITEVELASMKHGGQFTAVWKKENGDNQSITVFIRPAERYYKEIEQLYRTFQDNTIKWKTVHMGYLERFFDVFIDKNILQEKSAVENKEIRIDFSEIEIQEKEVGVEIEYGMVPLWNVERVVFESEKFKEATVDGIYYEHEISINDWTEADGYLIEKNKDILEIRHERKKIIAISTQEEFHDWKVLHITQEETVRSLDYQEELLTNRTRDTFLGRFSACSGRNPLITKAELFRRIMDLDIRNYIEIVGYEICKSLPESSLVGGMNWFITEELIPMDCRQILLLRFKALQPNHYLTDSMINFAISTLQVEFIEYQLVGIRV